MPREREGRALVRGSSFARLQPGREAVRGRAARLPQLPAEPHVHRRVESVESPRCAVRTLRSQQGARFLVRHGGVGQKKQHPSTSSICATSRAASTSRRRGTTKSRYSQSPRVTPPAWPPSGTTGKASLMRKARLSRTNFIRTMPERRERKGACGSKARLVARGLRATELLAGRGAPILFISLSCMRRAVQNCGDSR